MPVTSSYTPFFDRAAAIGQQDGVRVFGQTDQVFLYTALPKYTLVAFLKNKLFIRLLPFCFLRVSMGHLRFPKATA